jgi:hypothetical protein
MNTQSDDILEFLKDTAKAIDTIDDGLVTAENFCSEINAVFRKYKIPYHFVATDIGDGYTETLLKEGYEPE